MDMKFLQSKPLIFLFLIITIGILLLEAQNSAWSFHLKSDTSTYFYKAHYFLTQMSGSIPNNEYLPGAMIFFVLILLVSNFFHITYLWALFLVNSILLIKIAYLYNKLSSEKSLITFALILLFSGPIVLFRFDLFVLLWIILAIYFWFKHKTYLSMLALGFATLIKIFPIIFLPLFLIMTYKKQGILEAIKNLLFYCIGIGLPLLIYMFFFKVSLIDFQATSNFHGMRPVSVEGVWGVGLTLLSKFTTGEFAKGFGDWGTFGIDPSYVIGPLWFYSNIWILPLIFLYVWFFSKKDFSKKDFFLKANLLIVLTFLLFYKSITPQYFLWFLLLLPILNVWALIKKTRWIFNFILIILATSLYQYIYPLNYTKMINFYLIGSDPQLFWINLIRNLALIIVLISLLAEFKSE